MREQDQDFEPYPFSNEIYRRLEIAQRALDHANRESDRLLRGLISAEGKLYDLTSGER